MENSYLLEADKISKRYDKYRQDIHLIYEFSKNVPKDLVKYVLKVLKEDSNPEVGKVVVDVSFDKRAPILTIIKALVKTLYVVKHMTKYKYGDYFTLKKFIDEALDKQASEKSELTKKKYQILLARMEDEKIEFDPKNSAEKKGQYMDALRDNLSRQYIRFV